MASLSEVERFLKELRTKMEVFGVIFLDDRGKNAQALHDLEISPAYRNEVIKELTVSDYSEGPLEEKMRGLLPMWVFGKAVKSHQVYIKISMGVPNQNAICISFHKAEYKMNYPYKK